MLAGLDIRDYRVRWEEYADGTFKNRMKVQKAASIDWNEIGWKKITDLEGDFFESNFRERNRFNIPGPFYGAVTDTCETGPDLAPDNIILDADGQEFIFRQPSNDKELRNSPETRSVFPETGD